MKTSSSGMLACLCLLLAGCGSVNLWPFGGGAPQERSRVPANATAYQCEGGKPIYVRMLENGAAAWVILPEREIRLEREASASGTSYAYRVTRLEISANEAALFEGDTGRITRCKAAGG